MSTEKKSCFRSKASYYIYYIIITLSHCITYNYLNSIMQGYTYQSYILSKYKGSVEKKNSGQMLTK